MDTTDDFSELLETPSPPTQRREPIVIPRQLVDAACKFIRVKSREKIPLETGWQKPGGANYPHDDELFQYWINRHGGNYGVLCSDTLLIVDADDPEISDIAKTLPETFTVETGGGGKHFYFRTTGAYTIPLVRDKTNVGHLRAGGAMVVGPGSTHPNGGTYRVLHDVPIADVNFQQVSDAFTDYIKYDEKNVIPSTIRRKTPRSGDDWISKLKLSDVGCYPDDVKHTNSNGEIQGTHPIHGSSTGMNFCVNERENVWYCHRCGSGGGPLLWLAVAEGIISCSDARPGVLRGDIFKQVVARAEEMGLKPPREAPGEPTPPPTSSTETDPDFSFRLENNVITRFLDYTGENYLGFPEIHFHSFITTISAITQKNAVCVFEHGALTASVNSIFATPPGEIKSTIIRLIERIIERCDQDLIIGEMVSTAAWIDELKGIERCRDNRLHERGFLILDECDGVISKFSKDTALAGTETRLNKIFDGQRVDYLTKDKKKRIRLMNPFMPILFATTTTKLGSSLSMENVSSGHLTRYLPVVPVRTPPYERGKMYRNATDNRNTEIEKISDEVAKIYSLYGDYYVIFDIQPLDREFLLSWGETMKKKFESNKHIIPEIQAFGTRFLDYALKLAMLFQSCSPEFRGSVTANSRERTPDNIRNYKCDTVKHVAHISMDRQCLEEACRILEDFYFPHVKRFCGMLDTDIKQPLVKTRNLIKNAKVISRSSVLRKLQGIGVLARDLDGIISTLDESGDIFIQRHEARTKPVEKYVWVGS